VTYIHLFVSRVSEPRRANSRNKKVYKLPPNHSPTFLLLYEGRRRLGYGKEETTYEYRVCWSC